MCYTCDHVIHMSTMIQIRNVPTETHQRLKALAAKAGMSLSDYLLSEIQQVAELPTMEEMQARLASRSSVTSTLSPAEIIREVRDRE